MAGRGDTGRGREQVLETVRAVVMQAPVPMAFYEAPDLRIAIANDRYLDVVGRRDIVGRPLADAVPELAERGADSLAILLESIAKGTPGTALEYNGPLRDADGTLRPRYFNAAYQPVRGDAGELYGVISIGIEVTETVRARHVAEQYARRMTVLAEASHAYVEAGLDLDKVYRTVVEQLVMRLYDGAVLHRVHAGVEELELVAVAHRDPERRAALEDAFRKSPPRIGQGFAGRVATTGASMLLPGVEPSLLRSLPKPAFIALTERFPVHGLLVVPVHAHGKLLGTLTVAQFTQDHRLDLDDQVLVEELADRAALAIVAAEQFAELRAAKAAADIERAKFESLVMRSPVPTVVYEGPDHRLALMNDMATTLASAPALGLPILKAFPQVAGTPLLALLDEAFITGERRTLPEHITSVRNADGDVEDRVYVTTLEPLRDAAQHVIGVLVAASDVTEQVDAREEIEASLRFCEQLLGMLGHDLRNPLNAITVAATYLRFTAADGDVHGKDMVDRILDSSSRMSTMVTQLLDLTRTRLAGGIALARRATTLSAISERALAELRLLYPAREIELDVRNDARGAWDADRLVQVFSNLIDNALAYGDATRPVSVRIASDEEFARVEVHNEGSAIPADLLPVLFEPYRRTGARNRESRGLGLGLYISQQIVRVHGGDITVQSTAASGTTFTVTLPM